MDNTLVTPYEQLVMANLLLAARATGMATFGYTNYKGSYDTRNVRLLRFSFGHTDWHKEDCILLHGFDEAKNAMRTFAVADIAIVTIASYGA